MKFICIVCGAILNTNDELEGMAVCNTCRKAVFEPPRKAGSDPKEPRIGELKKLIEVIEMMS